MPGRRNDEVAASMSAAEAAAITAAACQRCIPDFVSPASIFGALRTCLFARAR
jgi:hypothetical protein